MYGNTAVDLAVCTAVYLELSLLEDDVECLLLLAGDLLLLLTGDLRLGDLVRAFPDRLRLRIGERRRGEGERRRPRGEGDRRRAPRGDGERRRPAPAPPRAAGERRFGDGRRTGARCISTGAAVISCPSICPPSICFMAFWASSAVLYSTYANPLFSQGLALSLPNSISLIFPKVEKISSRCSLRTFLVSRPMWILVGCGVPDLPLGFRPLDLDRDFEADFRDARLSLDTDLFLAGEADLFLGGGVADRFLGCAEALRAGEDPLRGGGDPLRGGGEPLRGGIEPFFSTRFSGSPFLSSFDFSPSLDFSPPFFFFPFFLSLDLDLLVSELLLLESLLLSEELLELLCFLFFFPALSLGRPFLSSSLLLLEEELRPLFFSSFFFSSTLSPPVTGPEAIVLR